MTCLRMIGMAPEWNTTWGPMEASLPSAVNRALLKSPAPATMGETDTAFRARACSSLIAASLCRMISKVTGSTDSGFFNVSQSATAGPST